MNVAEQQLWTTWRTHRDERAFEALVGPHLRFAVDLACRVGCAPADADDLVQRSLLALVRTKDERPARVGVRAWLGRRIVLDARTLRRAAGRRRRHESNAPVRPLSAVAVLDTRDEVDAALEHLEPDERHAVVLRFLHDLDYGDVAYVLGCPPATARVRVHRALEKLRIRLGRNASTLLATCALLTGGRTVHAHTAVRAALTAGGVVMSKTLKIALAALALLLVVWMTFSKQTPERERAKRNTAAHSITQRPVMKNAPAPPTQPAEDPIASGAEEHEAPALATTWRDYDSVRALNKLKRQSKNLTSRLEALGVNNDDAPQQADATTRLYLESLIAKYRALGDADARMVVFRTLAVVHRRYVERTGDLAFLPLFKTVAGRRAKESATAVGSLAGLSLPQIVSFAIDCLGSDDRALRIAAIDVLADVKGSEARRAHDALLTGLRDVAPSVRWTTAIALEYAVGSPEHAVTILDRLVDETHPVAMHAMVRAVLALDPKNGRHRIDNVLAAASPKSRSLGESALTRQPSDASVAPAKGPGWISVPRDESDPETRAYLDRLVEEFAGLAEGDGRMEHVKNITRTANDYLRRTGDTSVMRALDQIVNGRSTVSERRTVVTALWSFRQTAVVDQVIAWGNSDDPGTRLAALPWLTQTTGKHAARAQDLALARLQDQDTAVRRTAAYLVASIRENPKVLTALVTAVAVETDVSVAYALVNSILRQDKERGRARIDSAIENADAATRKAVQQALKNVNR